MTWSLTFAVRIRHDVPRRCDAHALFSHRTHAISPVLGRRCGTVLDFRCMFDCGICADPWSKASAGRHGSRAPCVRGARGAVGSASLALLMMACVCNPALSDETPSINSTCACTFSLTCTNHKERKCHRHLLHLLSHQIIIPTSPTGALDVPSILIHPFLAPPESCSLGTNMNSSSIIATDRQACGWGRDGRPTRPNNGTGRHALQGGGDWRRQGASAASPRLVLRLLISLLPRRR